MWNYKQLKIDKMKIFIVKYKVDNYYFDNYSKAEFYCNQNNINISEIKEIKY